MAGKDKSSLAKQTQDQLIQALKELSQKIEEKQKVLILDQTQQDLYKEIQNLQSDYQQKQDQLKHEALVKTLAEALENATLRVETTPTRPGSLNPAAKKAASAFNSILDALHMTPVSDRTPAP